LNRTVSIPRVGIIILIQLLIASIHAFRLGQAFSGELYLWYYSYFSDFILPFAAYFLLSINVASMYFLRPWYVKVGIILAITVLAEILQFFGLEVLGATFDPFDILAYATGVLLAAFVDKKVFSALFGFWNE